MSFVEDLGDRRESSPDTEEVAKEFIATLTKTPFKKSDKEGAKLYPRSLNTVRSARRILSGLWEHLRAAKMVNQNPWEHVATKKPDKTVPKAPTEADIEHFFEWLDAKNWELLSVFFRVKAFLSCRTKDLCYAMSYAFDPKEKTLTIVPEDEKTHTERIVTLPDDLAKRLESVMGKTYLWDRYTEDAKTHRPGRRNAKVFTPSVMYWFVDDVCPQYRKAHPKRFPITPHDLRRRGITLTVREHGMDAAANAIGIHPDTARRYYLDSEQAFKKEAVMKSMASVLVPK